jgi:hypothetical protein
MMSFIFSMIVGFTNPNGFNHICWANAIKDSSEGSYSWSRSRELAIKLSLELCNKEFGTKESGCEIEYCERYSLVKKIRHNR